MTKEIRIGEQVIVCNRDATAALYADAINVAADDEECLLWKNFAAQSSSLYPIEFLGLLNELGADQRKEVGAFIYECEPGQSHSPCGGYFLFVGELLEGVAWRPQQRSGSFTFWFTPHFPHGGLPQDVRLCAIEFCTDVPSVNCETHRHRRKLRASLDNLEEKELEVVRECLRATVEGPFYPDWEFGTIFGLERDDVKRILMAWPEVNEADEYVVRTINNSLNNILGYPARNKGEMWPMFISVTPAAVARILDKWKGREPRTSWKPRNYFEDAM
ncbi:MAG TPA: hypothetical protein VKF84_18295 [Candidatus Sulfotelmatobacter sp.]|nr:hypothetical protein [Candidatus Sulfotelmatobacter sp.]